MRNKQITGEIVGTFVDGADKSYNVFALIDKKTFENMFNIDISNEQWETFVKSEHDTLKEYFHKFCAYFINERFDKYFGGE